jgi:hypothetical protein
MKPTRNNRGREMKKWLADGWPLVAFVLIIATQIALILNA